MFALALQGCDVSSTRTESVVQAMVTQGVENEANSVAVWQKFLNDGDMHLILCGTASPAPAFDRAGQCLAVIAGGEFYVVDSGTASARTLNLLGMPLQNLSAVFLTHFHSDHISDLGELTVTSWIAGRAYPLPVYGPRGVSKVVAGFNMVYELDQTYRTGHHTEQYMPKEGSKSEAKEFSTPEKGGRVILESKAGMKVTAFEVDHWPAGPACGYRFEYKGRTIVITGDSYPFNEVDNQMKGADIAVRNTIIKELVEMMSGANNATGDARVGKLLYDTLDYHSSPKEAMRDAMKGDVKMLVLSHLLPYPEGKVQETLFRPYMTVPGWDRELVIGRDGDYFALPPHSKEITKGHLNIGSSQQNEGPPDR